jgi:hypothetical protein
MGLNCTEIIQVRGKSLLAYPEYLFARSYKSKERQRNVMRRAQKDAYSGVMSAGAKKRIVRAISMLAQITGRVWGINPVTGRYGYHCMSFLTLNIPGNKKYTSKQGYIDLLRPFQEWMTKTMGVNDYVWKSEFQLRGALHYHIVTPTFLDYREVRKKWNALLHEAGLLDDYAKEYNHFNANTTDVHEIKHPEAAGAYMMKELQKDETARWVVARKRVDEGIQSGKYLAAEREELVKQVKDTEGVREEVAARRVDKMIASGKLLKEDRADLITELAGKKLWNDGQVWGCSLTIKGVPYYSIEMHSVNESILAELEKERRVVKKMSDEKSKAWWIIWSIKDDTPMEKLLNPEQLKDYKDYLGAVKKGSWKEFLEDRKTRAFRALAALLGTIEYIEPVKPAAWEQATLGNFF